MKPSKLYSIMYQFDLTLIYNKLQIKIAVVLGYLK